MRLLNFYAGDTAHLGLVQDGEVFDLTAAAPDDAALASVAALLRLGNNPAEVVQQVWRRTRANPDRWQHLDSIQHAPLIARDCRIFAVGLNYADHAAENNLAPPESPIFFEKLASSVTPHSAPVPLPACSNQVDYEAEFAVVIGRRAHRVREQEAAACIAGYTIMNDVTARDFQMRDKQWFRGKNCDGFAPLGPWLVTADEIADPHHLDITLRLNGGVRQHSNTDQLFFKPPALLAFLSQSLTLEPGDVISTGTPAGVGYCCKPQVFLRPGDRVEIEIEHIGTLRNTFIEAEEQPWTAFASASSG